MKRLLALTMGLCFVGLVHADRPIRMTILHGNDLHTHLDPTMISKKPYGGYARLATLVNQYRKKDKNLLFLNGGDVFQGTLYFNVYEGLADLALLNYMGLDAMAVGNHEFDRGPATLSTFVKGANFPVLGANLDVTGEPALSELVKPSTVVTVGGQRVGIVGITTPDLPTISNIGPNVRLRDLVPTVQMTVDQLTKQGINKIILVGHNGYDEDMLLAAKLRDVDLIVGGHSHSPLGVPELPGWPKSAGPYPTYVKDLAGVSVPIVQAWEWGKVLGHLVVDFDGAGRVMKVSEAKPIVVDESIPEDPVAKSMIQAFSKPIAQLRDQRVGVATVTVARDGDAHGESLMGNVIADAMFEALKPRGAVAAFVNAGGVRASIEAGPITYGMAVSVQPFNNSLVLLDLTGAELLAALKENPKGGFLYPSKGTSYRGTGPTVRDVMINGAPLKSDEVYRIAFPAFTAGGGDAHDVLKNARGTRTDTGLLDIDVLLDYLKRNNPLAPKLEGRVRVD